MAPHMFLNILVQATTGRFFLEGGGFGLKKKLFLKSSLKVKQVFLTSVETNNLIGQFVLRQTLLFIKITVSRQISISFTYLLPSKNYNFIN